MKISVIVPVYNAEKYLSKCIDSVIAQTYADWEMILIDDGSKDDSWNIIREYEKKDHRVIGIQQSNAGPGKARNAGLKKATGDFVVFLDSDDYIDRDYFQLLQDKSEDADVVFIDILQVDPDGKLLAKERMSQYKSYSKEAFQRAMMTGKALWGGVRKAVRLKLIKDHNIEYSALKIGEEALFSFRLFEVAERIDFIDEKPVYMYVNHEGSQSKLTVDDPWGGTVKVLKEYLAEEPERYQKFANTLNAFNVAATIVSIDRMTQMYRGKERKQKIASRMDEYREMHDAMYPIDKKSLVKKASVLLPFLKNGITSPIVLCSKLRKALR